jgi:hypothetical protein
VRFETWSTASQPVSDSLNGWNELPNAYEAFIVPLIALHASNAIGVATICPLHAPVTSVYKRLGAIKSPQLDSTTADAASMDPRLKAELATFNFLSPRRVFFILKSESGRYELTKALVNVLYNIVRIQSLPPTDNQKHVFAQNQDILRTLLSPKESLVSKKRLLESHLELTLAIAESCQT